MVLVHRFGLLILRFFLLLFILFLLFFLFILLDLNIIFYGYIRLFDVCRRGIEIIAIKRSPRGTNTFPKRFIPIQIFSWSLPHDIFVVQVVWNFSKKSWKLGQNMRAIVNRTINILITINSLVNFLDQTVKAELMMSITLLGYCIHIWTWLLSTAYLAVSLFVLSIVSISLLFLGFLWVV